MLTSQFRNLEGSKITVCGREVSIKMYGMFDLSALNTILGKQNHSATFFDAWTNCRLDHIQNHSNVPHKPDNCKNIEFVSLEELDQLLTHKNVESPGETKSGKHFGSVISDNLLPLKDIFRYIPPLMHIIMGLGNNVFNELKRVVMELDSEETGNENPHQLNIRNQIKDAYEEQENICAMIANYNLDKMIALNDVKRITLLVQEKPKEALEVAKSNYKQCKSRKKKLNCSAEFCIIFPCDQENGFAEEIDCDKCQKKYHVRCEGIMLLDEDEIPETYECKFCWLVDGNSSWLRKTLKNGVQMFTDRIQKLNVQKTQLKMHIEKLEEEDSHCGERQNTLKESCGALKINPAKYHGGDFEGKAIQQMLDCSRDGKFIILDCIRDKIEFFERFQRALQTLQEVSDCFKKPITFFTDEDIEDVQIICEKWGKDWPFDFPHLNITPKAHNMIFVLPEILKRERSFFMFYKMEERGESIHAELNAIQRRIWCIRDPSSRLWAYIERYELRNSLDISIVDPIKRKCDG